MFILNFMIKKRHCSQRVRSVIIFIVGVTMDMVHHGGCMGTLENQRFAENIEENCRLIVYSSSAA